MKQNIAVVLIIAAILTSLVVATMGIADQKGALLAQDLPEDRTVSSIFVDEAPTLDGVADEDFWGDAEAVEVLVRRGANAGEATVMIKSVYTEDSVFFLVTWDDPTESNLRSPWEMQEDGTWLQLRDPDDLGGDNNLWYEDKLAFIWPIANSIPEFEEDGCFAACHEGENEDVKPYGNKYTEEEGQMGDIWHWKSVRNLNQVHDQYLDNVQYSEDTPEAGRHSDPADEGGYRNNVSEDGSQPLYMLPGDDFPRDGSPGYILESEAVPFDASLFEPGDRVPSIYKSEFVGDGGDISAGWVYEDGIWTLEFGRLLVTGSEFDVQFDDLASVYWFGVAVFDNAQVRHAYHRNPVAFVFEQ